jgi:hypothetical protein
MRQTLLVTIALAVFSSGVVGQTEKPPTAEELAEIAARGHVLGEYDQAAWHASDAVEALHPAPETVQRYVARKTPAGWIVDWGYFDKAHTRFLITYEARQGAKPVEFTVARHDPPQEDTDFFFHAASALETARKDFAASAHPARPYNISVLPSMTGDWYVYAIPAQQDLAILPYGGDLRYEVSFDGARILDRRQMHKTVLEESLPADGGRPAFGFHSHILSDVPEDSDIFYAMTRRAELGEWVATKKYTYEIMPDFSLGYLGETKQVADFLSNRDCRRIRAHVDLCADKFDAVRLKTLSALWRLSGLLPDAWPLQPNASFDNAQCKNGQIWLTLTISLRNVGDSDLLISRAVAGNWIQARLAGSPADLLTEKYEKLVFASIDPKFDQSKDDSFAPLSPGKAFEMSKDVPLIGLDPKGKSVVQFLVFTWFPGDEKLPKPILDRFANSGTLFTDSVLTDPLPFALDPMLADSCGK